MCATRVQGNCSLSPGTFYSENNKDLMFKRQLPWNSCFNKRDLRDETVKLVFAQNKRTSQNKIVVRDAMAFSNTNLKLVRIIVMPQAASPLLPSVSSNYNHRALISYRALMQTRHADVITLATAHYANRNRSRFSINFDTRRCLLLFVKLRPRRQKP